MSAFRDSAGKILLAVVLVSVWGVLMYKRMHAYDDPPQPPAPPVTAPAAAEPPKLVVGAEASVLATINWADPADPRAVPLRNQQYLFDTRDGVQIWNSGTLALAPLQALPPSARLLDQVWMRYSSTKARGTLFAVHDGQLSSVALVRDDKASAEQRLMLPIGFIPDALVPLGDDAALLCSSTARQALVVSGRDGELKLKAQADSGEHELGMLRRAGIVGPVTGFADQDQTPVAADGRIGQPLWFDTRTCRWRARALPEPMARALDLTLAVRPDVKLNYGGIAIVAASWRDSATGAMQTLQTPLVWNSEHNQWWQRKTADLPGVPPRALVGLQEMDWSYAAADGHFAFHGSMDEQWREATQRLPAHDSFKLLYSGNEGVFVLLAGTQQPGRIVQLDPAARFAEPRTSIDADSVVPFGSGQLMVLEGRSAKVSVISPDLPKPAPVASLPQALRHASGVELADRSILVFGGLDPRCDPGQRPACPQRAAPALRWIPVEQRWQPVPSLTLPYATGTALEGGSTAPDSRHGRSDFVVRGNDLFYLSSNAIQWAGFPRDEASRLYRWQLGGKSEPLAQTHFNRSNASLVALNDGRLAVVGGAAAGEGEAPSCTSCLAQRKEAVRRLAATLAREPDGYDAEARAEAAVPPCESCTTSSVGEGYLTARSSEVYDPAADRWSPGPWANHADGRALKLANGRIFKFGLISDSTHSAVYGAETADPALSRWSAAPPFPLPAPAAVKAMHAIGNQVLLMMETPRDRMVLWDDDSRSWQVRPLPRHASWSIHTLPRFITRGVGSQLLLIYDDGFEYLDWP